MFRFYDTRSTCAFNSTCTQFRKFFGSVKLTKDASERFMFEHEFRERIQVRLVSPVRKIHTHVPGLSESVIAGSDEIYEGSDSPHKYQKFDLA